ncbi:N,N-dimethylformamidase beta subunit family domain-containing protein [Halocatena marina]|uniref:N,N-dimethylformamidase beta subunit family domain-containing protein n=1 Tax=Halocatena marina TaxID=2934937 RepID=A0ABD5YKH9_9EURY|nr:N,N-dimethylformamidase beta subunit family domain-containing protein [Halocatena marina]
MSDDKFADSTGDGVSDGNVSRRGYLRTVAGAAALSVAGATASAGTVKANPITVENRKSGDARWFPSLPIRSRPWRITHRIEGYTSQTSITSGEAVEFHVSTDPPSSYRVEIYRLGWYGGDGGRLVACLPESRGTVQPIPDPDQLGKVQCNWPVTDRAETTKQWTTGLYLAKFVRTGGKHKGDSTAHAFAVRPRDDAQPSKLLVQLPYATSQAYNGWGGKSLYGFTSTDEDTDNGTESADVVSYDRPRQAPRLHMSYAIHALRFLEREGYDVSYVMDSDVHRNPEMLQRHDLIISSGHDEYWSRAQRDGFEAARDAGTNVAFLAANTALWQIRYEDDRTIVGYKENVEDDPMADTQDETGLFRDLPDPRPECELLGVMGTGAGREAAPNYTVVEDALDHPWMRNTGFKAGDTVVGCIGHEWDYIREDCAPSELTTFFHYEEGTADEDLLPTSVHRDANADAVAYEASSGAHVFSTGSLGYNWRLDPDPSWASTIWPLSDIKEYKPEVLTPDKRLQAFTRNVLNDLQKPN